MVPFAVDTAAVVSVLSSGSGALMAIGQALLVLASVVAVYRWVVDGGLR